MSRLRSETGDGDIRRLSCGAADLHENFCENTMQAYEVGESLDDIEALLDKFRSLLVQA